MQFRDPDIGKHSISTSSLDPDERLVMLEIRNGVGKVFLTEREIATLADDLRNSRKGPPGPAPAEIALSDPDVVSVEACNSAGDAPARLLVSLNSGPEHALFLNRADLQALSAFLATVEGGGAVLKPGGVVDRLERYSTQAQVKHVIGKEVEKDDPAKPAVVPDRSLVVGLVHKLLTPDYALMGSDGSGWETVVDVAVRMAAEIYSRTCVRSD